jgi:putative ABC transport system permease protein
MRAAPVRRAVRGGLKRRRVQTFVIGLVLLVSTGASVLALGLLVDSSAPFDHAFAAQRGAHAELTFNLARATSAELAATRTLSGVTAAAGPFREATISPEQGGYPLGPMTVVGRANPLGPWMMSLWNPAAGQPRPARSSWPPTQLPARPS